MKALENIRDEWKSTSKALHADYNQLIADGKTELTKYQHHVKESGQTLVAEVQTVQQKIDVIEQGLKQMNAQYTIAHRDIASLQILAQVSTTPNSGVGGPRDGKAKILESRLVEGIEN